jgi:outer membrane protein assembly factor BamB
MGRTDAIFIGIKGHAVAIDRATGQEIWQTELKGSDFVTVALQEGDVLAATHGELFCLDAVTGRIRWHNALKGLGFGLVSIAGAAQSVVMDMKHEQDDDAAGAAGMIIG